MLLASVLAASAAEWPLAIFRGDWPDPTILRDGEDFYMTHTPFDYAPAFEIWHSHDLVNWTSLGAAKTGSVDAWAPDLVKANGKYYIYYPSKGKTNVIWADDVRGPWSEPVTLDIEGIDPGHVQLADGSRWLFTSGIRVARLSDDGLSIVGETKFVWGGWQYPEDWLLEGFYLESPKAFRHGDYIYLTCAQGGTAGPPTSHMAVVARAKHPLGTWETSPHNPLVHTYSVDEPWWSQGHATVFDDAKGGLWMVYHAYPKGFHTLGRYTLLQPLAWTEDGWFKISETSSLAQSRRGAEASASSAPLRETKLWRFWRSETQSAVTNEPDGAIRVAGHGWWAGHWNTLLATARDESYEVEAEIETGDGNAAGLMLFYNADAYAGLLATEKGELEIYGGAKNKAVRANTFGRKFTARLVNDRNKLSVYVNGYCLARGIDVSHLNHNNYGGFLALRPALVSAHGGESVFRKFTYRPLEVK